MLLSPAGPFGARISVVNGSNAGINSTACHGCHHGIADRPDSRPMTVREHRACIRFSNEEIDAAGEFHGVTFPPDVREYLRLINGMPNRGWGR
ncbi:MAG: hypothetical protein JWQ98_333 [Chlorobi bacterium]|nr:hypothetical protein [Chlorobiota bacterium]